MSQDFRYRLADALSDLQRRKPEAIEAASEIMNLFASYGYEQTATLRARLALLESVLAEAGEALEPFAECGNAWMKHASDGWPVFGGEESKTLVVIGDLRRAATVSAKIDEMDAALKEDGK